MRRALALLLLAGCVTPAAVTPDDGSVPPFAPDFDFASALIEGHDHGDAALHDIAYGLELVGHAALDQGGAPGGFQELAMAGGWAFVSNFGPDRGFTIVDVSDPAAPKVTGEFYPTRMLGLVDAGSGSYWDVSVTEDASLVVLSSQASVGPQQPGGVLLVNVEDKTKPVLESFTPVVDTAALLPAGVHNANPFVVDGKLYVAATTGNGATHLFAVEGSAPRRTLQEVSVVAGMHDSAVQVHPLTGRTLLYTASRGVFIWDVTDPARPEQLAFLPDGPDLHTYHETIPSNVLIGGRHYTVAATESMEGEPTPFTILDTTDPTDPLVVGDWTLPLDPSEQALLPYQWSGHNVDFDRGRVYVGHYHAGVWVLDVSTPERAAAPEPVAVYLPHEKGIAVPRTPTLTLMPSVWRATYHTDGLVWAIDATTGLYALRPTIPASPVEHATLWPHNIR